MSNIKFHKLRHKPSGLFYTPNTPSYAKSNLSKKGKVYQTKLSFSRVTGNLYCGNHEILGRYQRSYKWLFRSEPKDWEIVVYTFHETETIQYGQ